MLSEKAKTVVEIGLAYGGSALAIGEALLATGGDRPLHLLLDPFQESEYANVGWEAICSAGLDTISTPITERSQIALPRLVTDGFTADAAFVDGSHIFENVFVDLYFLKEIVRPGGLIILDDLWWPSEAAAARYFELNSGWQPMVGAFENGTINASSSLPRVRAERLPDPRVQPSFKAFQAFC